MIWLLSSPNNSSTIHPNFVMLIEWILW